MNFKQLITQIKYSNILQNVGILITGFLWVFSLNIIANQFGNGLIVIIIPLPHLNPPPPKFSLRENLGGGGNRRGWDIRFKRLVI